MGPGSISRWKLFFGKIANEEGSQFFFTRKEGLRTGTAVHRMIVAAGLMSCHIIVEHPTTIGMMLNVLRGATVAASMGLAARASWNSHCEQVPVQKEEILSEDHIRDFHRIRDKCSKISSKDEAAANGMSWDFKNWTAIPGRVWHDETQPMLRHSSPAHLARYIIPNRDCTTLEYNRTPSTLSHFTYFRPTALAVHYRQHCYRLHQHPHSLLANAGRGT